MLKKDFIPSSDILSQPEESCCDSVKFIEENGYIVCLNCGCVYQQVFDNRPQRAFTREQALIRNRNEPVYCLYGPRTVIRGSRDARGTLMNAKNKGQFIRLSKIHRSLTTSYERNLWIALPNLQRLQKILELPNVVAEDALRIYTYAAKEKLTMGRSIDNLLVASILAALRVHKIPRSIDEIAECAQVPIKKIMRSYAIIFRDVLPRLQLKAQYVITAERYIDKFIDTLNLSMDVRNFAIELLSKAKKRGFTLSGKDPKGVASASIYLSIRNFNQKMNQKKISDACKITEVTLRARCTDLKKYLSDLIIMDNKLY